MANECRAVISPELLHRALENIVRNAVRYTADQTEVEVLLLCKESDVNSEGQDARLSPRIDAP